MSMPASSSANSSSATTSLPTRTVFFGPPGAGKGTQANLISAHHALPVMDMGATIRKAIKEGTGAGEKAKSYVERGALVPPEIVIEMALERLAQPEFQGSWILDGFPRSIPQAEALEAYLALPEHAGRFVVVNFHADPEALVSRLSGRLICPQCATIYNTQLNPPAQEGVCSECGHHGLTRRKDDEPEVIRTRLQVYSEETQPLIDFYTQRGVLVTVDAMQEIGTVTAAVETALGWTNGVGTAHG